MVGVGGAIFYFWHRSRQSQIQPVLINPHPAPSTEVSSPAIQYPVPNESNGAGSASARPGIPALDQSDSTIQAALASLFGKDRYRALFSQKDIVRRIVVTTDNAIRRRQPSQELWPLNPPDPGFLVTGASDALLIDEKNSARYKPYVELFETVNARKLVQAYFHFYPLFQAAYRDLGTRGYFNDRLVEVINAILQTPEVVSPIHVVRTGVGSPIYRFEDGSLESLSAAQKVLLRMGPEKARIVKTKLREIRMLLTRQEKN